MQPGVSWLDGGGALWSGADERAWHVDVGKLCEAVACLGLCAGYTKAVAETVHDESTHLGGGAGAVELPFVVGNLGGGDGDEGVYVL